MLVHTLYQLPTKHHMSIVMMRCSPTFHNILSDIFKNKEMIYGFLQPETAFKYSWGVNYEDQTDHKWVYSNCKQQIIS